MGVQSSSDHVSTHISYAAVYVDRLSRKAILDAYRARRSYAATDNIIVDFRIGGHAQGAEFEARLPPAVTAAVEGTGPIAKVSLIKNNLVLFTQPGGGASAVKFQFTDAAPAPGDSYYYIRVEQTDGQLAWSSPIWVRVPDK